MPNKKRKRDDSVAVGWGGMLESVCNARGLTQRDLDRASGVPHYMISRIMRGAEPSRWVAVALEVALGEAIDPRRPRAPLSLLEYLRTTGVHDDLRRELGLLAGSSDIWLGAAVSDWPRVVDAIRSVMRSRLDQQLQPR